MAIRDAQDKVREFMLNAGQDCPHWPFEPDTYTKELRCNLIKEELEELWMASFPGGRPDIPKVADAIGDLLYVALGTAVSWGINIEPVFDEIHRSNMTKFIDGHKSHTGKWIKGLSYTPPNLDEIIAKQMENRE